MNLKKLRKSPEDPCIVVEDPGTKENVIPGSSCKPGIWFGRKTEDDRAATIQLLSIIKSSEMLPKFKGKGFVDSSTWKVVAGLVSEKYDLGSNPCRKVQDRYNYLLKNYRAWKDNSTKTGARALKKPDFFDEIDDIKRDDHSVSPKLVLDSTKRADLKKMREQLGEPRESAGEGSSMQEEGGDEEEWSHSAEHKGQKFQTKGQPPLKKKEKRSGIKDALQLLEVTTVLMQEDSEKANKYRKDMKDLYEKDIYMRQEASNRLLTVFESYVDIMKDRKQKRRRSRSPSN
ncbi:uncharacterized protein LOC136041368 isoform X2 [Artemia franciscana]|uniref:uncharacterized protein LOC136041368 isoform X2 n=1 Tax=Artemia franciscana TaxID=6661 RepID=UPI0032DB6DA7